MRSFMKKTIYLNAATKGHSELAAQMLKDGKLVAFPTETVYGLGALGLNEACVANIFAAKSRPSHNPLILHVSDIASAKRLFDFEGSEFSKIFLERFELLSRTFWPGPITLVGKKSRIIPQTVCGQSDKVAVRIPAHPTALKILQIAGEPVAAPSANLYSRPSPTQFAHVLQTLDTRVDAIIDAGPTEYGIESTVLDIDAVTPKILRHGAISQEELQKVLPLVLANPVGNLTHASPSPGQCVKHYSPKISEIYLAGEQALAEAWFTSSGIVLTKATQIRLSKRLGNREATGFGPIRALPNDPKGYARELFAAFYEVEIKAPKKLLIENPLTFSSDEEWAAVSDRLIRAQTL